MNKAAGILFGIVAVALWAMISPALAQENYPSSSIKLIYGFAPGSRGDLVARLLAQKVSTQMNANAVVENKTGASGNIGAEFVAKSKPDGYTVLYNTATVILSRALGEKLGYDVLKDLEPVARVASGPVLIVVNPSLAANNVAEFIAHIKANPDKLAYGSSGAGSASHLSTLLFLQSNGLSALHIPYKGTPAASIDLIAGRIQFAFVDGASVLPLVKDKRLRVLATTGLRRSPVMPDVPTVAETVPGLETGNWFGVMVPAKTPRAIIQRLNSEIVKALQDPDLVSRFLENDALPLSSTPEEYGAYLRSELERWTKVIKSAGVKAE